MILTQDTLWAGTEASLHNLLQVIEQNRETLAAAKDTDKKVEDPVEGGLYELTEGGTAIISIKGALISRDIDEDDARFFGISTYPHLQRACAAAIQDERVERVLLDVDSPGGEVRGIDEALSSLRKLGETKPMRAFTNSMASAAYWLGSTASDITMSELGMAGSIGVITTHIGMKGFYEQEGMKPTVIRSGDKKALGHPLEDLSDEAKADIEERLSYIHDIFTRDVAKNRRMTIPAAKAVSNGKCFYGAEAVESGLVDHIDSFASCLADFEASPSSRSTYQPSGVAAISSGEPSMNLEEALAKVAQLEGDVANGNTALAAAEANVATLTTKLEALQAAHDTISAELVSAKKFNESYAALLDAHINTMATALNMPVLVPEALADKQSYHDKVKEKFEAKFPAGGVAATSTETVAPSASLPEWAARVIKN